MPKSHPMSVLESEKNPLQWFVMRDLKRPNAKCPAYQWLAEQSFEVFTPMKWEITRQRGRAVRRQLPYLPDLLFVHSTRDRLDPVVALHATLQYRFLRGEAAGTPMVVPALEMDRFIRAVQATAQPRYFTPAEITPEMLGKSVRVVSGSFDGLEGRLLRQRGSRKKHLIVEVPSLLVTTVEIEPEYLEFLNQP